MRLGDSFDVVTAVRALATDQDALREVMELLKARVAALEAAAPASQAAPAAEGGEGAVQESSQEAVAGRGKARKREV